MRTVVVSTKIHSIRIQGNKPIIMKFPVDLSLVDLDPCKVEECIRESGWVIINKVYVGKPGFKVDQFSKYLRDVPTHVEGHPDAA
jgi:hypothetical protein